MFYGNTSLLGVLSPVSHWKRSKSRKQKLEMMVMALWKQEFMNFWWGVEFSQWFCWPCRNPTCRHVSCTRHGQVGEVLPCIYYIYNNYLSLSIYIPFLFTLKALILSISIWLWHQNHQGQSDVYYTIFFIPCC